MENKEIFLTQGSLEWKLWRRTKLTATDTAKILNENPFSTPYKCYMEKIDGTEIPINAAMQQGMDKEDEARQFLIKKYGINLKPKCFESTTYTYMAASLDAVVDDNTFGYEIKCPGEKTMTKAFDDEIDDWYLWQCQKQMLVMGWHKVVLFFYFSPEINIEVGVLRDDDMIKRIIEAENDFWHNNILKFNPPATTNKDFVENTNDFDNFLAKKWLDLCEQEKRISSEKKEVEEQLKTIASGSSCIFVNAGVKHAIIQRKGNVDWDKVCMAYSVPKEKTEDFRKDTQVFSMFTKIKEKTD